MNNYKNKKGLYTKEPRLRALHEAIEIVGWWAKRIFVGLLIFGWAYVSGLTWYDLRPSNWYNVPVMAQNTQIDPKIEASAPNLSHLGVMGEEIILASEEFDVPVELLVGIANAESSQGKNFVHAYDHNCHNWWGIRKVREDGSYLRCFNDEKAGARTAAKLLKNYYIDEGRDTPEKIVSKWVGGKYSNHWDQWVYNVKNYQKFLEKHGCTGRHDYNFYIEKNEGSNKVTLYKKVGEFEIK